MSTEKPGLLERLEEGPVICAEGYLFECERRGYLQAGAYVPEVVLDHPEVVSELHREFVHAGSDVVEAFTYYAHREKLRLIGKEDLLEERPEPVPGTNDDVATDLAAQNLKLVEPEFAHPTRIAAPRTSGLTWSRGCRRPCRLIA